MGPAFTDVSASLRESIIVLLVTRDLIAQQSRESYQVMSEPDFTAYPAVSGPHIRLTNFKVPDDKHVLAAPDVGAQLIERCLGHYAALTGAFSVSVMRSALSAARRFAKLEKRGYPSDIINYQQIASILENANSKSDTTRSTVWGALGETEAAQEGEALKQQLSKSFQVMRSCSDKSVLTVTDLLRVVGPVSYSTEQPFTQWLLLAASTPLLDCWIPIDGKTT